MGKTSIEWTDKTWSPLRVRVKDDAGEIAAAKGYASLVTIATKMAGRVGPHCEHQSEGCINCYSESNNHRCLPSNGTGLPFERRSRDLVDPFVDEKMLCQPARWPDPAMVFVENQSDLFGEWNTDAMIDRVFDVMAACHWHTFQVLTKCSHRMGSYLIDRQLLRGLPTLPNVWLGVSAENQKRADIRVMHLLRAPAAVRFISYEPALEAVHFKLMRGWCNNCNEEFFSDNPLGHFGTKYPFRDSASRSTWCHKCGFAYEHVALINWIICGGESGYGARPFDIAWPRDLAHHCAATDTAFFMKQMGAKPCFRDVMDGLGFDAESLYTIPGDDRFFLGLKDKSAGGDPAEWAEDLRIRQFPLNAMTEVCA